MTTRYNTAALRDLISAALSGDELTALAFDHFRPVYDQFAAGQTRHQRVQLLLDHAVRSKQMARLAALIQEINPARYREFAGRLLTPAADAAPARPQNSVSYQATLTGSGAIATCLRATCVDESRVVRVEYSPNCCALLLALYPRATGLHGDAYCLRATLADAAARLKAQSQRDGGSNGSGNDTTHGAQ